MGSCLRLVRKALPLPRSATKVLELPQSTASRAYIQQAPNTLEELVESERSRELTLGGMGRSSATPTLAARLDESERTVSELSSRLGAAEIALSSLISQVAALDEQLKASRLREERPSWRLTDMLSALLSGLEQCLAPARPPPHATGPLRLIISGAPASGKGTQCERTIEQYGIIHLSTGDMLRAAVKSRAPLGVQAEQYMQAGQLVPDDLIISIVVARLQESDCAVHGWMLDGFPRSAAQAAALREAGFQPDHAIQLVVPDDVLVERVVNRRLDPVTGKIYNVKDRLPESEEVAARVVQRPDDTEEVARKRLATYYSNLAALEAACAPPTRRAAFLPPFWYCMCVACLLCSCLVCSPGPFEQILP